MQNKNIKKLIVIAIGFITVCQIVSTISICSSKKDIHMVYEVKQGESLKSVASKFNTSQEKLQELNNIGEVVEPGMRLKID